jgi:integrating conjugative element protein (TIGR03749 family)
MSFFLALSVVSNSFALEVMQWERLPLRIPLIVGQERVIFVDRPVRVGLSPAVEEQLRVQSAGGAVYLRANAPIESTRVQLQDNESGLLILIDVSAEPAKSEQIPLEPVRIVSTDNGMGLATSVKHPEPDEDPAGNAVIDPSYETPRPVVLTRYAAQQLYAPLRTIESVAAIAPARLSSDLPLDTLLPTLPVQAKTLGAWRLDDLWVTAVRLTNTSAHRVDLDPRLLLGDFVTATFQHRELGPKGDSTDTSVVYLVTRNHGLAESLLPAISPINAALNLPLSSTTTFVEGRRDAK